MIIYKTGDDEEEIKFKKINRDDFSSFLLFASH